MEENKDLGVEPGSQWGPAPAYMTNALKNKTSLRTNTDWIEAPGEVSDSSMYYDKLNSYDQGFIPGYENQEDRRAKNQGGIDLAVKGLMRFAGTTLTKAGSGISDALGFIFTGGQVDSTNNIISQGFRSVEDYIKESMPVYKSDQFKEGSFWDKIKTGEWWADIAVDAAASAASAWLTGNAVKGLGAVGILGKAGKMIAEGESVLAAGGELAKGMTTGQKLVNNIVKAGNALGIESIGSGTLRLGVTGINTLGESMAEGYDAYKTLKDELMAKSILGQQGNKQYEKYAKLNSAEIEAAAKNAYSSVMSKNMVALAFSNYIEAGWILGKAKGGLKSEFFKALDAAKGDTAEAAKKFLNRTSPWGKMVKEAGIGILSEAYWQENIQSAIQKYEQAIFDPTLSEKERALIPSIAKNFVNNAWNGTSALLGLSNDKESKEAAESIFLGGLLGSMGGSVSALREHSEDTANRDNTVNKWWKTYQELEGIRMSGFIRELSEPLLKAETKKVMVKTDQKKKDSTGKELDEFEEKEIEVSSVIDETTGLYKWNQDKVIQDLKESLFNDRTVDHAILAEMAKNPHYAQLHAHYSLFNLAGQIERSSTLDEQDKDKMAQRIIEQFKKDKLFDDPVINVANLNKYRAIQKEARNQGLGDQVKLYGELKDKEDIKAFDIFLSTLKQNYAVETFRAEAFREMQKNFMPGTKSYNDLENLAKEKETSAEQFNVSNNPEKSKQMFNEFKKLIDFKEEQEAIKLAEKVIADNPTDLDLTKKKEAEIARNKRFIAEKKLKYGYTQAPSFYAPIERGEESEKKKETVMSSMKANRFREEYDIDARISEIAKSTLVAADMQDLLDDPDENKIFDFLLERAQVEAEKATEDPRLQAVYTVKLLQKDIQALKSAAYFDNSFSEKLFKRAKALADQLKTDQQSLVESDTKIFGVLDGEDFLWENANTMLGKARTYWGTNPQLAYEEAFDRYEGFGEEMAANIYRNYEDFVGFPNDEMTDFMNEFFDVLISEEKQVRLFRLKPEFKDEPSEAYKDFLYGSNQMWMDYLIYNTEMLQEELGYEEKDITSRLDQAIAYNEILYKYDDLVKSIDKGIKYGALAKAISEAIDSSQKTNKKFGIKTINNVTTFDPLDPKKLAEEFFIESSLVAEDGVNAMFVAEQIFNSPEAWEEMGVKIKQGTSFEDDISLALKKLKNLKKAFDVSEGDIDVGKYKVEDGTIDLDEAIKMLSVVEKYIETMTANTIDTVNAIESNKKRNNQVVSNILSLGELDSSYSLYDMLSGLNDKKAAASVLSNEIDTIYGNIATDFESLVVDPNRSASLAALKSTDNRPNPIMIISMLLSDNASKVWRAKADGASARGEKISAMPGDLSLSVDSVMHMDNFIRTWFRTLDINLTIKEMKKDKDLSNQQEMIAKIQNIMVQAEKLNALDKSHKLLSISMDMKSVYDMIASMPKLLNGTYPNYQQINAFIESVIELEYGRQVEKKTTKIGLMGVSGSGKTMMSRFVFDYFVAKYGAEKVYMIGHIKESAENLKKAISPGFSDKNVLTNQELYTALETAGHPIHNAEFIVADEQLTLPNNEMQSIYGNKNLKATFLFIGDAAQPRGEARSYLSEFDKGNVASGLHKVAMVQPLSIGYRTYIPSIESAANVYKDKTKKVAPLNVYSDIDFNKLIEEKVIGNGVIMSKGDAALNIISAIENRRGDSRTRVVIVNNKVMKDKYSKLASVPNVEILTYSEVQGRTFDEAYIDIDPTKPVDIRSFSIEDNIRSVGYTVTRFEDLRADFYNSIMYMTITRAKNFSYIHNYDNDNVENHVGDLTDQTLLSDAERDNNKSNFANILTSFGIKEESAPVAPQTAPAPEEKTEAVEAVVPPVVPPVTTSTKTSIPVIPSEVLIDAADEIDVPAKPETLEETNDVAETIQATYVGDTSDMEMLGYPSRLNNLRLTTASGTVKLKLSQEDVTTGDEAWVDVTDAMHTFIAPMYSSNNIKNEAPNVFALLVPVKVKNTVGDWIIIGYTPAAVLGPDEVKTYSALNFSSDKGSRFYLNYKKGELILPKIYDMAKANPLSLAVEITGFNDLSIQYDFKQTWNNSSKINPAYDSWLDQYIISFLSDLTQNEVTSTNKEALEKFIREELVEVVNGKKKVKAKWFKNGLENAKDGKFAIIFEVATPALYNPNVQKGEYKLIQEDSELAHLIDSKGIKGSPIMLFKNVPISADKKTKADFFSLMDAPSLTSESQSIKAIASYQANVNQIANFLGWGESFHTPELSTLAYASREMFFVENDVVKSNGFTKEAYIQAIRKSTGDALVSMTNKQKLIAEKTTKQKFLDKNTIESIDRMHQALVDKMKAVEETINAMDADTYKLFVESAQRMTYGSEGALFGLSEKNKEYNYNELEPLGLEPRFDKNSKKLILQSKAAQSDALDENVGETEYYVAKHLTKEQLDALSNGQDIDMNAVSFEFVTVKKLFNEVKKEKTKYLDPYVSPIFSQIQYFASNNLSIDVDGQMVNIGGRKPTVDLNKKRGQQNQVLLHAINPIDSEPNFSNLQRLLRSALFTRVMSYQTTAQFVFDAEGHVIDYNQDFNSPLFLFKNREEAKASLIPNGSKMLSYTQQKEAARFVWRLFPETPEGLETFISIYGPKGEYANDDISFVLNDAENLNKYAQPLTNKIMDAIVQSPEKHKDNVYISRNIIKSNPSAVSTKIIHEQLAKDESVQSGIDTIKRLNAPTFKVSQNSIKVKRSSSVKTKVNDTVSNSIEDTISPVGVSTMQVADEEINDASTIIEPIIAPVESFKDFLPTTDKTSWESIAKSEKLKSAVAVRFDNLVPDTLSEDEWKAVVEKIAGNEDFSNQETFALEELKAVIQTERENRSGESLLKVAIKGTAKVSIINFYDESQDYEDSKIPLEQGRAYVASVLSGMNLPQESINIITRLADGSIMHPERLSHVVNGAANLMTDGESFYKDVFHHEFLHLILRYGMTAGQRKRVYLAAKKHYEESNPQLFNNLSQYDQEEYIANTFEAWMKGKDLNTEPKGFLRKIFYAVQRVLDFFLSPNLNTYFKRIQDGVYYKYQTKFDELAESAGHKQANYSKDLRNPLYDAFDTADDLLTVTNAVRSRLNYYIHNGYLLDPTDPNSKITLSIHQIQRLVYAEIGRHELDIVKETFARPDGAKIYEAIIDSFAKNSSKQSMVGADIDDDAIEADGVNIGDETISSEEFDILNSPTSRFYELSLLFVTEEGGKIKSLSKERIKEILTDINEYIPFSDLSILSKNVGKLSGVSGIKGKVAGILNTWVSWVKKDIDPSFGRIHYHFVDGKGNIVLHANESMSNKSAEEVYQAYLDKNPNVVGKFITQIWDPADLYVYIRDNAFEGNLDSNIFSALYNKALGLNYLKTLSFTVGSLKQNHYTMDVEDVKGGITHFQRKFLDRNDYFASILNRLPDILLQEWYSILADNRVDGKVNVSLFKGKDKRIELNNRLIEAFKDKASNLIDSSIKSTSAMNNNFFIILDQLILDAELFDAYKSSEDAVDFNEEYLLDFVGDDKVATALKAISDYYQRKDKSTMNHSLVSSNGKKIYKFTTSSFLDNVLRVLSSKDLTSEDKEEIFPFLSENWLKYNHFVNSTDKLSRSSINLQTTHDGFKYVWTGTSKPAERENTMEYYRRLVTFSFMSTLLSAQDNGQYYYDQETYQLAHRSRAQSIRTKFLSKDQATEAIVNIFRTLGERPSKEIEAFFNVKKGITTQEEDKANYKLFMNLSFLNNDISLLKDNKEIILNGSYPERKKVAEMIIDKLFDSEAKDLAENMMLYETPVHADILSVMEILETQGYLTKSDVNSFSNLVPEKGATKKLNKKTEQTDGKKVFWYKALSEDQKKTAVAGLQKVLGAYMTNRYANMWHLNNLFSGDMLMYSDVTDLVKRNLGPSATGQRILVDEELAATKHTYALVVKDALLKNRTLSDKERLEKFRKDFGNNKLFKDLSFEESLAYLNELQAMPKSETQTDEDYLDQQEYVSKAINVLESGYQTSIEAFLNRMLESKYQGKELEDKIQEILLAFGGDVKATDGQGIMSYEGFMNLRNGLDDAFGLSGTIKMVYFGVSDHGNVAEDSVLAGKSTPFYAKNSYIVLTPELMNRFPELKQLDDFMKRNSKDGKPVHEILFDSNIKIGAPKNLISTSDMLSEQLGLLDSKEDFDALLSSSLVKMNNNYRRVQFNPKSKLDSKVALPTQLLYMIGTMTPDNQRVRLAYTALSYLFEKEMHNILYGKVRNNFSRYILDIIGKSPEAYFYYDLLTMSYSIDKTILNDPYIKKKFITSLISGTTKDAINIRFRGSKMILVSSDLISNRQGINLVDESKQWRSKYADRLTYKKEIIDGAEQIVADVIVPKGMFDKTPEILDNIKKGGMYFASGDLLSFRIPTTGKHSGVVFRVVDVHDSKDNIIFAPAEMAAIHGSDFDVDSLFTIQRSIWDKETFNITYDINGRNTSFSAYKGKPIGYLESNIAVSNSSVAFMDNVTVEQQLQDISDIKIYLNKMTASQTIDKETFKRMKSEIKLLESAEDILLRNIIIEQMIQTLTSKDHWDEMLTPITMEFIGPIIKKIKKAGYVQETEQAFNLSLPQDAARMHYNVFAGLNLVGVNANSFKSYAYIFRAGLSENTKKQKDEYIKQLKEAIIKDAIPVVYESDVEEEKVRKKSETDSMKSKFRNASDESIYQYVFSDQNRIKKYQSFIAQIQELISSQVIGEKAQIKHTAETRTIESYTDSPMSSLRSTSLGKLNTFNYNDTDYSSLSEFSYQKEHGNIKVTASTWLTLDTFINLAVDNVKEGKLAQLRLDFDTINASVASVMLGMPFEGNFNYQPSIGLLKWGQFATVDNLNRKIGLSTLGKRPVVKTTGLNESNNSDLAIGQLLVKTLMHVSPTLFTDKTSDNEVDADENIVSKKKVSYVYLDSALSHTDVPLTSASFNRNMTKEKNLAIQNLFTFLMKFNKMDIVKPQQLLNAYNEMLSDETKVDMDQFIFDLRHNLKVLVYFKALNKIGEDMKVINSVLNTIRMNATDITSIDETLKQVKKLGNIELGLVYKPTDSFSDYKEVIDKNKYYIFNDSFSFDITNFFNINPQIRSSVNLLEEINKIMKDEKISPWTSNYIRTAIDNAWISVTGSKDFTSTFKYRYNGFINDDAAKYLMMDEMQRYALFFFWDKFQEEKIVDFDIKNITQYTKEFLHAAKSSPLSKNELLTSLKYDDDYLRFNKKRDIDTTESFALYKNAVNELLNQVYDPIAKTITAVELDEDGNMLIPEEGISIPVTHLLGLASKFSKTASAEAEDSVYRVLDFATKDYINNLFQAAFVVMKKEHGSWIPDTTNDKGRNMLNEFNKGFVTSFLRRNIVFIDQIRSSTDGDLTLFDTGNKYTTEKGKERIDYSGMDYVNGLPLFYDLKVITKNDKEAPQFASLSFNLHQKIGKTVINPDGSKTNYYVSLGSSKLFSADDTVSNIIKHGLNNLRVIANIKEEKKGDDLVKFITTAKDLESLSKGIDVIVYDKTDTEFKSPVVFKLGESTAASEKVKSGYDRLNQKNYYLTGGFAKADYALPESVQMNEFLEKEADDKLTDENNNEACQLPS